MPARNKPPSPCLWASEGLRGERRWAASSAEAIGRRWREPTFSASSFSSSSSSSTFLLSRRTPSFSPFPHAFLGVLSVSALGCLDWAHADAGEMQRGTYPAFAVSARGQKITVKFRIPPSCEVSHLIVDLVSHLGLKVEQHGGGSEMLVRAWDRRESTTTGGYSDEDKKKHKGNLCVLIYESLVSSGNCEIEFIKEGTFTSVELDALVSALKLAGEKTDTKKASGRKPQRFKREKQTDAQVERIISSLEAMGVRVYGIDEASGSSSNGTISWDNIAGYEQQKREIEDTILLSLHSPQVYDEIAWATRRKFETNRPRAVLFEGPPGTGKTSCARVIANQAVRCSSSVRPLEVVVSKYYGESERMLGNVFSLANDLPDGAIIFLDEIDSFAASRDSEIHEATRRMLSVLLRQIDGFEQEKRVIVIAATNRKQDLDPALISRFDTMIPFFLPDQHNREKIASQYAKHLKVSELAQLAEATEGMSGRDIRDVCQQAERRWASKLIRGQAASDAADIHLPPLEEYVKCAEVRQRTLQELSEERKRTSSSYSARDRGLLGIV
ncbi:unnamed protein product [Spirodela intermedia]|uniref:AAA+ ATPase domain-containing protein n=1 Tax=Spirodela intermedia TaxID=51605 RepID=A0A7I8JIR5_SPIIN|nr:unnamed protein product [Spirodela intermedia]CAA6670000.1 unnamed protein product [Spirodela intermedia]